MRCRFFVILMLVSSFAVSGVVHAGQAQGSFRELMCKMPYGLAPIIGQGSSTFEVVAGNPPAIIYSPYFVSSLPHSVAKLDFARACVALQSGGNIPQENLDCAAIGYLRNFGQFNSRDFREIANWLRQSEQAQGHVSNGRAAFRLKMIAGCYG